MNGNANWQGMGTNSLVSKIFLLIKGRKHRISIKWTSLCKETYTVHSSWKIYTCWLMTFSVVFVQCACIRIWKSRLVHCFFILSVDVYKHWQVISLVYQEHLDINQDETLFHNLLHKLKFDFWICLFWKWFFSSK